MSRFRDITLRQLRALAAISETGSVTAAAQKLHLTQPAVTLQLRALQAIAGLPLTQRTSDGLRLTDAGRQILALTERVEASISDCSATLDIIAGRTGGRVALGAVSTAKYFAPFAIAEFSKRFPNVSVSLTIGNREEIRDAMRGYDLDIAIMGRPPPDIDVELRLIGLHPHIIIAAAGHRLARKKLTPHDLANEPFITREPGSGTRTVMEQFLQTADLTPQISMDMGSNETIKQAVIAGLGIAFLSAHTVHHELADGRLIALNVAGLPVMRHWHVARRLDKVLLPPAQAMLDFLGEEGARFLPKAARKVRL